MATRPFLYSALDDFSGEFWTAYRCSIRSIPNYLSEVFLGFDYFDDPNSISSMKGVMRMRHKEVVEIAKQRPDLKEVAQTDEAPISSNTDVMKVKPQDSYFPLLVLGSSLIIFDTFRSIMM